MWCMVTVFWFDIPNHETDINCSVKIQAIPVDSVKLVENDSAL